MDLANNEYSPNKTEVACHFVSAAAGTSGGESYEVAAPPDRCTDRSNAALQSCVHVLQRI